MKHRPELSGLRTMGRVPCALLSQSARFGGLFRFAVRPSLFVGPFALCHGPLAPGLGFPSCLSSCLSFSIFLGLVGGASVSKIVGESAPRCFGFGSCSPSPSCASPSPSRQATSPTDSSNLQPPLHSPFSVSSGSKNTSLVLLLLPKQTFNHFLRALCTATSAESARTTWAEKAKLAACVAAVAAPPNEEFSSKKNQKKSSDAPAPGPQLQLPTGPSGQRPRPPQTRQNNAHTRTPTVSSTPTHRVGVANHDRALAPRWRRARASKIASSALAPRGRYTPHKEKRRASGPTRFQFGCTPPYTRTHNPAPWVTLPPPQAPTQPQQPTQPATKRGGPGYSPV